MQHDRSRELFGRARASIPGGVNSPARAFKAVGGDPVFIERGEGCRIFDVDGNSYIDFIGSWGPMILGHRHPAVTEAIAKTLEIGTSFGAPTQREVEIAELICDMVPSVEMVRLVNSGTEATMSAVRLARGYTGRDLIVKFEGNYHGHVDSLLVKAGSGLATLGISDSGGVPPGFAETTLVLPYNSVEAVEEAFAEHGDEIAGVILEPVVGNMGCILPESGYLQGLRDITEKHGAVLIFDEVMTGFRLAAGGVQSLMGVTPDLTTMGKVIGGGLPVGAYGGKLEIMNRVSPVGPVYQAGTLSGNPLAVAGGMATLRAIQADPGLYARLEEKTQKITAGIAAAAEKAGRAVCINQIGSMFTVFFQEGPVRNWDESSKSDTAAFAQFFRKMLEAGVYLPCSQFEAAFVTDALGDDEIGEVLAAAEGAFAG